MSDITPALQQLARLRVQRDEAVDRFEAVPCGENAETMVIAVKAEEYIELQVRGLILDHLPVELWDVLEFQIGDLSKFLAIPAESAG